MAFGLSRDRFLRTSRELQYVRGTPYGDGAVTCQYCSARYDPEKKEPGSTRDMCQDCEDYVDEHGIDLA